MTKPKPPYLPIARKYRPQVFEDLIGQPHVTQTLSRAMTSGRIGQAYLFTGQRGVGKTSTARILAKCLNCATGPTSTPCQECPSCLAVVLGNSLDVIEIDGASNRGIEEIRTLRETVKFSPTHGRFRVYIIDEVHMLTTEAFNALLKTLEEPPAHVKFIFATTAPYKVPATILSRCQRFDFRRIDAKTIVTTLQEIAKAERAAVDEEALYAIARASEGSLRDAEVVLEQLLSFSAERVSEADVTQLLGAVDQEGLAAWTQALIERNAAAALRALAEQLARGKDVMQLLVGLLTHVRNVLVAKAVAGASARDASLLEQLIELPAEHRAAIVRQAQQIELDELALMTQMLAGAYELARRSPFAQVVLELALVKLATRDAWMPLDQVLDRLEQAGGDGGGHALPAVSKPAVAPSAQQPVAPRPHAASSSPPKPAPVRAIAVSLEEPQTSAPVPQAAAGIEQIVEQWPKLLARIGKQKMSLAAYLMEAQPSSIASGRLQIGLPAISLHREILTQQDNIRLVERALRDVLGVAMPIDYVKLQAPAASPASAGKPSNLVQGVVDAFNAAGAALSAASAEKSAQTDPSGSRMPAILEDIVNLFDARIVSTPPSS